MGESSAGEPMPPSNSRSDAIMRYKEKKKVMEIVGTSDQPEVRRTTVTIGEALEASARTAGRKPVDRCETAAIKAAQYRATGSTLGELAAMADYGVAFSDGVIGNQGKINLADVLTGAKARLAADKVSTFEDVDEIMAAALTYMSPVSPSEVAAAVMEAVRENVKGRYDFHAS